jgi:GxxExxY protein
METAPDGASFSTADIQDMANRIMLDLGGGYSETIYQRALFNKLVKKDSTAVLERTIQVVYDGDVVGTCRADIVAARHVIEIKALCKMPAKVGNQIRKYMKNLFEADSSTREGLVINFNQETERVDFLVVAFEPLPAGERLEYRRRKATPCDE